MHDLTCRLYSHGLHKPWARVFIIMPSGQPLALCTGCYNNLASRRESVSFKCVEYEEYTLAQIMYQ